MKSTKKTKKTKDKDDQKSIPLVGKQQKIAFTNVFGGLIIAGILTLLNYMFGKSDITVADALTVALGTMIAVVFLFVLAKE